MAQIVQPEVFINYISQRKKIVVNAHNQPTQLLIQTDYNLNDTLYFQVINVNNRIVELDVNTTYQLYGTYIDARKQVHILFYTLGVTPKDNMLSFLVNTYTTQYLDYVKENRTPIDISIVAKQNTGGSTRSYMVLRDTALANPRGYIEGETPTDIVYQNIFNATVPVSGSFGAGQNINLAQDLEGQDLGSFAFGDTLTTSSENQFVIGYNNTPDATKAFIVANSGNIFTVDYEGNVEAGDLNVGAISATSITVSGEDLNQVIDDKVEYLSTAVDDKLSATEDWVSDTFETKESATQTFNELEEDIGSISAFVSGLPTDIAAKADQTDLETLSTTVEGLAETKANLSAIPTKTSDLTNDSGYITLADVPEGTIYGAGFGLAASGDANNIFYLTGTVLSGSEHISVANNVISLIGEVGKTYTGGTGIEVNNTNNTISLSATIPSAISDLTNDSSFATSAQVSSIVTGYNYITGITVSYFDYDQQETYKYPVSGIDFGQGFVYVNVYGDNIAHVYWKGLHITDYEDYNYNTTEFVYNPNDFFYNDDSDGLQWLGLTVGNNRAKSFTFSNNFEVTFDQSEETSASVSLKTVSGLLSAGNNITLTTNNAGVTTIAATGGGGGGTINITIDDYGTSSISSIEFNSQDFDGSIYNGNAQLYWKGLWQYGGIRDVDFPAKNLNWSGDFDVDYMEGGVTIGLANPILSTSQLTNDSEFATSAQVSSIVNNYVTVSGIATGTGLYYNTSDKSLNVNLSADANSNMVVSADNNGVVWLSSTGGGGITSAQVSAIVTGYNYISAIPVSYVDPNIDDWVWTNVSGLQFDNSAFDAYITDNYIYIMGRGLHFYDSEDNNYEATDVYFNSDFSISPGDGEVHISLANPIPLSTSQLTNDSGFITGYTAGSGIDIQNGVISCTVEGGDIKTNKQSISTGSTYNEKLEIVLNEYTPINSAITLSAFEVPSGALESGVATFEEWVYTTDAFSGVNTTNDVTFIGDTPDEFLPSAYHVFSRRLVNVNGTIKQFVSFAYQFESPIINIPIDPINSPLTFTGKDTTNAVQLYKYGSPSAINLQYSKNEGPWTNYTWDVGGAGEIINLSADEYVSFSGNNSSFSEGLNDYYCFQMFGTIEADGNIQSLMNFSNSVTDNCYVYLFRSCTSLTKAPTLPVTTLAEQCYCDMFYGCTNLTTPPQLPATTLADWCYDQMFINCTSLTVAPALPATTLVDSCYREMFIGCSSLSSINVAFTAWSPSVATQSWVAGVAANGTFTKPTALNTEYGGNKIPNGWTVVNK